MYIYQSSDVIKLTFNHIKTQVFMIANKHLVMLWPTRNLDNIVWSYSACIKVE